MSNKIKSILVLGSCVFFLACGSSTNERGISSTTSDSTASGSAYNSNDGFAPAAPSASPGAVVAPGAAPVVRVDSAKVTSPGAAVAPAASTPATAPATAPAVAAKPAPAADNGDVKRGEALIAKSDCLACHKVDVKVLGPSYKDVAAKYSNNAATVNQLVDKIKKGGSGVWGAVPMSPHPALSDDDGRAMVRYILSLK